jgi:hypothetical protein
MANRPKTGGALGWANFMVLIGSIYVILITIAGGVLFFTTDSVCDYVDGCSFIDKHPYAIPGGALFFSGLTFGAPMIAIGLYMSTQIKIQDFRLDVNSAA